MIIWSANRKVDQSRLNGAVRYLKDSDSYDPKLNFHTSFYMNEEERPDQVFFGEYYNDLGREICDELFLTGRGEFNYETWMQLYTEHSQTFESHDHFSGNELLSWVHFIKIGEDKCFHFISADGKKMYPKQEEGDIIVFPPWIYHAADPPSEGERVIIAGNISATSLSEFKFHALGYKDGGYKFGMWELCSD